VFDSVINYLDKFGPEILVLQFGFLVILSTLFLWLWFSNRRKYHNLKHAIPANVVKSYLDSIIQNSTSLKSQLFRGGGLDMGSIPSVMPLHHLAGGDGLAVSGAPSTALMEELNQKKAHIAALEAQLSNSQSSQREIESKLNQSQNTLNNAESKIKELEALLAQSRSGGGDAAIKSELSMVTKERNELRDRLKEFEIISDDLANLKRLQQENEQLKRSLAAQGGTSIAQPAPMAEVPKQPDVSDLLEDLGQTSKVEESQDQALEDFLSSPTEEIEDKPAPAAEVDDIMSSMSEASTSTEAEADSKSKSEKTPEDLLSEFEKMLG
jgi:hypothetical protein